MPKSYNLVYHPKAVKSLKKIHPLDRERVITKLEALQKDPFSENLNTRKLANTKNSFRLRIGNLRAIYELDTKTKTIYIWDINYRGSIY